MCMTALGNLFCNVAHLEQGRVALALGDKGANALNANEFALACEFTQRPVGSHLADAEFAAQFVFGGNAMLRGPLAAMDAVEYHLLDTGIERCGIVVPLHLAWTLHCLVLLQRRNPLDKSTFPLA